MIVIVALEGLASFYIYKVNKKFMIILLIFYYFDYLTKKYIIRLIQESPSILIIRNATEIFLGNNKSSKEKKNETKTRRFVSITMKVRVNRQRERAEVS